jgi:iron complex transport system ATP-binding protein
MAGIIKMDKSSTGRLTVRDLDFSYKKNGQILYDISFNVNSGESWAIIGKNGSGKTTLLRCIGRFVSTPYGKIFLDGKDLNLYSNRERAFYLSYVPQASGRENVFFTVKDYVLLSRYPYRRLLSNPDENDIIVKDALDLTDISSLSSRFMNTLSGGELQRVYIAGAVAQRSRIMLLDEPVSFLDPLHQELIYKALKRIHRSYKTTMITITHDINAALNRYSHILALKDGKVVFAGDVKRFLTHCPDILSDIYSLTYDKIYIDANGRRVLFPEIKYHE